MNIILRALSRHFFLRDIVIERRSHQECEGEGWSRGLEEFEKSPKGRILPQGAWRVEEGRNLFLGEKGSTKLVLLGKVRH